MLWNADRNWGSRALPLPARAFFIRGGHFVCSGSSRLQFPALQCAIADAGILNLRQRLKLFAKQLAKLFCAIPSELPQRLPGQTL